MVIGTRALLPLVIALSCASCTNEGNTEPQTAEGESYTQAPTPAQGPMEQTSPPVAKTETQPATPPPDASPPPAPAAMTDEQIFAVLDAANLKEIEEAKAVLGKTKNKEVKSFAQMMVTHHTDAKTKGDKLSKKLAVTPDVGFAKSQELRSDTTTQADKLKTTDVAEVDKAFIDLMIKDHRAVLDMIDQKLLVDAKNADLKKLITDVRPTIEKHLKDAEALQAKLAAGPAAAPSKATTKSP